MQKQMINMIKLREYIKVQHFYSFSTTSSTAIEKARQFNPEIKKNVPILLCNKRLSFFMDS